MRLKSTTVVSLLSIAVFLCPKILLAQVTLMTYYPSPKADYNTIRLAANVFPTGTNTCATTDPNSNALINLGTIFLDSNYNLYICGADGTAKSPGLWSLTSGSPSYLSPSTDSVLGQAHDIYTQNHLFLGTGSTAIPSASTSMLTIKGAVGDDGITIEQKGAVTDSARVGFKDFNGNTLFTMGLNNSQLIIGSTALNPSSPFFAMDSGGNVGIGAPPVSGVLLAVNGTIQASQNINIVNPTPSQGIVYTTGGIAFSDQATATANPTTTPSITPVAGTPDLQINGGGAVGIGNAPYAYRTTYTTTDLSGFPLMVGGKILATSPQSTDVPANPGNTVATIDYVNKNAGECYNDFQSFATGSMPGSPCPAKGSACSNPLFTDQGVCDVFQTSAQWTVVSSVCCK